MSNVLDLIKKIGEKEAVVQEFVSPIFFNDQVATKIDGLVYKFNILQKTPGWYKVRSVSRTKAKTICNADLTDVQNYLIRLKKIRLVLVMRKNNVYFAIPEKSNILGFSINQLIPVYLFDDTILDFDRIIARYDGANFWYHQLDNSNDPSKSMYLRNQFINLKDPKKIEFSGLTIEDKIAFTLKTTLNKQIVVDIKKESLKKDVEHAGGEFIKFIEKNDHFNVTYVVDGHTYTSNVSKTQEHSIITAGICLSGEDKKFDLKSLITVIREGQHTRKIYRMNNV